MIGLGFPVSRQVTVFGWAMVLGLIFGLLYDLLRVFRRAVRCGPVRVFIQDLFFFLVYAAATFLFLMGTCRGELPPYVLLGQFLGAVVWFCLPSPVFLWLGRWLLGLGKRVLSLLSFVFLRPLLSLSKKIAALFKPVSAFLEKKRKNLALIFTSDLKKAGKLLYNHGEFVYGSVQAGESAKRRGFPWNRRKKHPKEK